MSETGNPLAPASQQSALPSSHGKIADFISQAHSAASAQVQKLTEARSLADAIRSAMDGVVALGDNVTPEDVIKGAGSIVGKGGDPMQLASLLADMPQGGQALAAWVQQHDQVLGQQEKAIDQKLAVARHGAGTAALHLLAMNHIASKFGTPAAQAPAPNTETSNALN